MKIKLRFCVRYHTEFGESLWLTGNTEKLGSEDTTRAIAMEYLNHEFWQAAVEVDKKELEEKTISYHYFLKTRAGEIVSESEACREIGGNFKHLSELVIQDTWNFSGEYENAFYTAPFREVLFNFHKSPVEKKKKEHYTHIFKVKAPLLKKNQVVCLLGNDAHLGNWSEANPLLLQKEGDWWQTCLKLDTAQFPLSYKYGIYNKKEERFVRYEAGENRVAFLPPQPGQLQLLQDGFIHLPNNTWKGTGVAIPVFSLRSKKSFGVGEFEDIKLLVDWAKKTGIKLIQILPVNDTIATQTWTDSYPYAAISAFALHPLYINLEKVAGRKQTVLIKATRKKQEQLNELAAVDYEDVMRFKIALLKELYELTGAAVFEDKEYERFFEENKHWLKPYAAFCFYRDKYKTTQFDQWGPDAVYHAKKTEALLAGDDKDAVNARFYYFVQYHLHVQLKEATVYAHDNGIVVKGDIPIGVYRFGCDAWVQPQLYNMDAQAGAPPDDFTPIGQNWGFPTYNWKRMQQDGFAWWKQRFKQMSNYFDAFRIDHILGFFRIWSIPAQAVQGILGHFVPAIPVHYVEFKKNGIEFDDKRFCKPFISEEVLQEVFGEEAEKVKQQFLVADEDNGFALKPKFDTQQKVEAFFQKENGDEKIKLGLFELIANVLLFKQEGSNGLEFHFRIDMEKTLSYKYLIPHLQEKLRDLYINYFYRRQDDFWEEEAMNKLPYLKAATSMLICGEDLGMVPHCVPKVMSRLGILSLEIQRMPKDPAKEFFRPAEAPYLSVITPSTHDMSTIRGWWEEKRDITQKFYNHELGQWGDAPYYCEPWINKLIISQHLRSPAMWSIFQLQDLLGMDEKLRREDPLQERINNPANAKHYWQYRMHIYLEDLLKEKEFNHELAGMIAEAGRG